jgi:heavy metal sensor kinase
MLASVRARLTFWYVSVFGTLLIGFGVLVYLLISRNLYSQLDESLLMTAQATAAEFVKEFAESEGDARSAAAEVLSELQQPHLDRSIFEGSQLLASASPKGRSALPCKMLSEPSRQGSISFHTLNEFSGEGARVAVLAAPAQARDFRVAVVEPLHELVQELEAVRRIFLWGLPATLLVAGIGGFLLAKKSLSPVVEMSSQAKRIGASNLHERLTIDNPNDELGRLAAVFNELLSRLDRSFESMRTFMADASHELCTPLSIIRGEAEVALSQQRNAHDYRRSLGVVQDEAGRLSRIVDDMLALARADAGHPLRKQELYLDDLLQEACKAAQVLAARQGVALKLEVAEDVSLQGDEDLLRRLILNLLDNAIKHTPEGGSVAVSLAVTGSWVRIVVSDTGAGIPEEAIPHVFERFYRVDKTRSRADGGSGLGLSIAKCVAEAHAGSIDLVSHPGQGSTFTVSLPRSTG